MSATVKSPIVNMANGNGLKNGSATNGSVKNGNGTTNGKSNGTPNGSPTNTGGAPLLKRGFSAINANVHEMYVCILIIISP